MLYQNGQLLLALLVFLTTILFPLLNLLGIMTLLVSLKFKGPFFFQRPLLHFLHHIQPWNMLEVFMLAILVSVVKLGDIADILPEIALIAFVVLIFILAALNARLDFHQLWQQLSDQPLIQRQRIPYSLQKTGAYLLAAMILYIPANLLPVMNIVLLGQGQPDTLMGGILHLIQGGMWPLALIVFVASVFVPLLKLIVLSVLVVSVQWHAQWKPLDRTRLYRLTEFVGRWSMVDIFVIAILVALVQFGALAHIDANAGSLSFAAVVVLTMFAAHSFDPRLIWDECEKKKQ